MAATLQQVQAGIAAYIDREIIPQMTGWRQVAFGTGAALILRRSEDIFAEIRQNKIAKATGVIRADGMIDIQLLRDQLRSQVERVGAITIDVPAIGALKIGPDDIDRIYQMIMEG